MKFILLSITFLFIIDVSAQQDTVKTYYPNGNLETVIVYEKNVRQGEAIIYWENGNVKEKRNYVNDKIEGGVTTYYLNGKTKENYFIENGKRFGPYVFNDSLGAVVDQAYFEDGMREGQEYVLIGKFRKEDYDKLVAKWKEQQEKKKNSNSEDEFVLPPVEQPSVKIEEDSIYFADVEVMPEPIGGMNTIYKKLVYPQEAKDKKIEGIVKILAYIEKTGEVSSTEVVEGIGYGCDENARLSVYYTRFKPGLQKGKRMKVQMIIPIEFKLDKDSK
jgi:TonB family protein